MVKHLATVALILSLTPVPTVAQSLRAAATSGGAEIAAAQGAAPRGANPYKTLAIVLMGAGAGLTILAIAAPTHYCGDASMTSSCGTSYHKGVLFGGLGALSLGAVLYIQGEHRRGTTVRAVPRGAMVSKRIRF